MPVSGITIFGATTMAQGSDDPAPAVMNDPVYLSAEYIESAITAGTLQAGCLKNVQVQPPVEQWPERWHFLVKE